MQNKSHPFLNLFTNLGLLLTCSAMAFSGLVIQLNYHMGHHGAIDNTGSVFGIGYIGWYDGHLVSIVMVSFFAFIHFILHLRWYKAVIRKRLFAENNIVIILTIIFIVTAITGYIPLLIRLSNGSELTLKTFIEIHDKIALVLFVYLIIHVAKTSRRLIASFKKLQIYRIMIHGAK